MKKFSEYIKESYSFRLGGSQKKGFDQKATKTFAELEIGDTFYWWSNLMSNGKIYEYVLTSKTYIYKKNYVRLPYTDKHELWIYRNDKYKEYSFSDETQWCIATSVERLVEVVKDEFDKDIKDFEIERRIFESYNFRLGGSQQKGYEQTEPKTFAQLKNGDVFYFWYNWDSAPGTEKALKTADECTLSKDPEKMMNLKMLKLDFFGSQNPYYVDLKNLNSTYDIAPNKGSVIATDEDVLHDIVEKEFNVSITRLIKR